MREDYPNVVGAILDDGATVPTRLGAAREFAPALLVLTDPLDALPYGTGRGVVTSLAVVEALSLVAGEADPALFVAASVQYARYVDPETGELEVAYGPRVGTQMADAERRLRNDPSCRQAHVDFWRPGFDVPLLRAYPCVVSCGFTTHAGRLDAYVEMRSNDAWLGLPYDMFAFAQLQATLANVLGCGLGEYSHYARTLHLYEKHWEPASALEPDHRGDNWAPKFSGVSGGQWSEAAYRAQKILRGDEPLDMTPSESEYLSVMQDVVLPAVRR
jgi:thymidylate synthase